MPEGQDKESKTERATAWRREEARKKGKVVRSPEVAGAVLLMAVLLTLWATGDGMWITLANIYRQFLGHATTDVLTISHASQLVGTLLTSILTIVAPVMAAIFIASLLATLAQVGFFVTTEPLNPSIAKFNPVDGVKNLFGIKAVMQLGLSLMKLFVVLLIAYVTMRKYLPELIGFYHAMPLTMAKTVARGTLDMGFRVALLLLVIAALDYIYQKWQYERDMRMTKQEVKEEAKMTEGSPQMKSRIRSMQLTLARQRMLGDVEKADVIVRNPTHYAVALQYDPVKSPAPRVLAKGAGYMAQRILDAAKKHRIPTRRDAPLAQALYKACKVGETIPPKLFRAVARMLVHIFKAQGKTIPGSTQPAHAAR